MIPRTRREHRRLVEDQLAEMDRRALGQLDRRDRGCPPWCNGRHEWPTLHIAEVGQVDIVINAVERPNPAVQLYSTRITLDAARQLAADLLRAVEMAQS